MFKKKYIYIIFSIIFIIIYNSIYIIPESKKGLLLKFNKIKKDSNNISIIYNPGLHFKIPYIENVKIFDSKIQIIENIYNKLITLDKKKIIINSYIKWKIDNYNLYYLSTNGNIYKTETLIKKRFNDKLKSEIEKLKIKNIIINQKNKIMNNITYFLNYNNINNKNIKNNLKNINNNMLSLGIKIIDIRINKINLTKKDYEFIYKKIILKKKSIADFNRFKGKEIAEKIKSITNYKIEKILSEANKKSLIIKGKTDSKINNIFANAFKKDINFYIFIKKLKIYEKIFNKNDTLILNSKNELFKYFKLK